MASPPPAAVREVLSAQHGVITRTPLTSLGVSDQVIAPFVRNRTLVRLHPGTFVEAMTWLNADEERRQLMRLLGVQLQVPYDPSSTSASTTDGSSRRA